jgi:molecular chaperone GrpE
MDADMVEATDDDVSRPRAEAGVSPVDVDDFEERASEVDDSTAPAGVPRPDSAAGEATDSAADDAAEVVTHDIEALVAERDQFKDIALRLQADFENYRRRVMAQQADEIDRATGRLVEALLPVLDACEAAFAHGVDGVEPIWSALIGALQRQGLEALDLEGAPFDPARAEAVVHEPGDGEPVVSEVLRTGYTWKGKVLRPAMVKVRG